MINQQVEISKEGLRPDPNAQEAHSTLSTRKGEKQGHTFNEKGQL